MVRMPVCLISGSFVAFRQCFCYCVKNTKCVRIKFRFLLILLLLNFRCDLSGQAVTFIFAIVVSQFIFVIEWFFFSVSIFSFIFCHLRAHKTRTFVLQTVVISLAITLNMPSNSKQAGVGAVCTALSRFIHPSKCINDVLKNRAHNHRLTDLLAVRKELKKVNRKMQMCIIFRHDMFPNEELHCCVRYCRVVKEGACEDFFQSDLFPGAVAVRHGNSCDPDSLLEDNVEDGAELPSNLNSMTGSTEDIQAMLALGFDVDDDDAPAPENVPDSSNDEGASRASAGNEEEGLFDGQSWGWSGFCDRKSNLFQNINPKMNGIFAEVIGTATTYISLFLLFFPRALIDLIVRETNKSLIDEGKPELEVGEFMRFLGLQLFMSTLTGFKKDDYWSATPIEIESGAPYRFGMFMSRNRFNDIVRHLTLTDVRPPGYTDKFWEVRQMIQIWNENIDEIFSPGWICCLDESMSIWYGKYSCPGWVFCPRKPHPFGNEYHDICCGMSGIIFRLLMVEGKDEPKEKPKSRYSSSYSKTTSLLLELCKTIMFTGRVVILDSGFCVLKALLALRMYGVYASAVIKKRRYWPAFVKGDIIEKKMNEKDIGECDAIKGEIHGTKYHLFFLKDSKYVMKLMTTYGSLTSTDKNESETSRRLTDGTTVKFKYTECFQNHYKYRHGVDDHNNLRHQIPSIEGSWLTSRWPIRVLCFLLAVSEVNTFLAFRFFIWNKKLQPSNTLLQFRRKLAIQLIHNDWLRNDDEQDGCEGENMVRKSKRRKGQGESAATHDLLTAPPYAKSFSSNGKWICTSTLRHAQFTCRGVGCKKRIRTYCKCNPFVWLCNSCFLMHFEKCIRDDERKG